ncbi:MAG: hypothetical protein M0R28_24010 [Pigmentiphaga sp.]|nr:hypothetical protein [Pigmentiphaga sp.]
MARRKNRSWRVKVDKAGLARLGSVLVPNHDEMMAGGYVMCATSGLWRTRRGTYTARLAYRCGDRTMSIVHTIRGIQPGAGDV